MLVSTTIFFPERLDNDTDWIDLGQLSFKNPFKYFIPIVFYNLVVCIVFVDNNSRILRFNFL